MIFEQNLCVGNSIDRTDKHKRNLSIFAWNRWLRFIIAFNLTKRTNEETPIVIVSAMWWLKLESFVPTFTRTTPLLSTISWMIRPFFPITLPTKLRGTWMDSSPYSSIARAFRTASSVSPKILNVQLFSSSSICVTPSSLRAVWILVPCAPIARPIKSSRTRNSSVKLWQTKYRQQTNGVMSI